MTVGTATASNVAALPPAYDFDRMLSLPAASFCPDEATRLLKTYGCCILRGGIPQVRLQQLRNGLNAMYDDIAERHAAGALSEDEIRRNWRFRIVRPVETDDRLDSGENLGDAIVGAIVNGPFRPILRRALGDDLALLLPTTHARRQIPTTDGEPVPFHQDSAVMRMHDAWILNFWIPMDACGVDAPSIEMIPLNLGGVIDYGNDPTDTGLYSHLSIAEKALAEIFNLSGMWRPTFEPGDVLVLGSRTIHRTHRTPAMNRMRMDHEVRFCRAADVPADRTDSIRRFDLSMDET